ncbi:hypothetical protein FGB62_24g126 [Gracilaria domingensis]|nr:hypothetical protein FGB62_24g126 [Gracilaria domingensis]
MLEDERDSNFRGGADGYGALGGIDDDLLRLAHAHRGHRLAAVIFLGADGEQAVIEADEAASDAEELGLDTEHAHEGVLVGVAHAGQLVGLDGMAGVEGIVESFDDHGGAALRGSS